MMIIVIKNQYKFLTGLGEGCYNKLFRSLKFIKGNMKYDFVWSILQAKIALKIMPVPIGTQ